MNEEARARIRALRVEVLSDRRAKVADTVMLSEANEPDLPRHHRQRSARHSAPPGDGGSIPTIRIIPGEVERIVDEAEAALIKAARGLYQRSDAIVIVALSPAKAAHGREISALRIVERTDHALIEDLAVSAQFERFSKREKAFVACDPPMWIVPTLRGRAGRLRFPILSGVVNAPTLRADGTILHAPGYDDATGLVFDPRGVVFPDIPDRPTRAEAEEAFARLLDLLSTFPFVADRSRSVALSAILTACVRPALPTAPLHAFSAPVAGSGKSKLVDIASTVALGHEAPVISPGASEEELEKRLGAALLAGAQIIALDNISDGKPLAGDLLCQALTQTVVAPRILGKSETPPVSNAAFVSATGNNLVIKGDLTRRTILCRLDAGVERPESRVFEWDAVDLANSRRPEYVAAALTCLRAWVLAAAAGAPNPPPLGSFEAWSQTVRGALMWLGGADPVETMGQLRESDPVLDEARAVISAWRATILEDRVTVADVIRRATEARSDGFSARPELINAEFHDALLVVAGRGGALNARALGQWLTARADRIVDGAHFVKVGTRRGVPLWAVRAD